MHLTNPTGAYEVHELRTQSVVHRRSAAATCSYNLAISATLQKHARSTYDAEVEAVGERHL